LFFALFSIHFVSSAILEQFETIDQALDFIASAPCLEGNQICDVGSSAGYSKSSNYSSQAIALPLRQITFVSDPLPRIIDWFCRCHPTPSVHTVQIHGLGMGDNIYNFIRHLGSALENLTIGGGRSKCISDRYFTTLTTFISCHKKTNRSISEYFSSQYLLYNIPGFTEATLLWLDYFHPFRHCSLLCRNCNHNYFC
jgi:hypothetical protein